MTRILLAAAVFVVAGGAAHAQSPGCQPIAMSPNEAARVSIPVPMFRLSKSDASFPDATKNELNASLRGKALGNVSGVSVYRGTTPEEMARMQGKAILGSEGWKAAYDAPDGMKPLGDNRWVGLFSDGKADILVRVEASPGWPRADMPGSATDKAKLRELASRGEAVVWRYEGRGIAKAACEGALPGATGAAS